MAPKPAPVTKPKRLSITGREQAKMDSRKAVAAYNQALIDWQTNQSKNLTDIYKMQRSDWETDLATER